MDDKGNAKEKGANGDGVLEEEDANSDKDQLSSRPAKHCVDGKVGTSESNCHSELSQPRSERPPVGESSNCPCVWRLGFKSVSVAAGNGGFDLEL